MGLWSYGRSPIVHAGDGLVPLWIFLLSLSAHHLGYHGAMPDLPAASPSPSSTIPDDMRLVVRIARIPAEHPAQELSLHELLPAHVKGAQAWFGHSRRMVAWGEAARIGVVGVHAIRDAARAWDDLRTKASVECLCTPTCTDNEMPALPMAFGSFGFSATTPGFLTIPAMAVMP